MTVGRVCVLRARRYVFTWTGGGAGSGAPGGTIGRNGGSTGGSSIGGGLRMGSDGISPGTSDGGRGRPDPWLAPFRAPSRATSISSARRFSYCSWARPKSPPPSLRSSGRVSGLGWSSTVRGIDGRGGKLSCRPGSLFSGCIAPVLFWCLRLDANGGAGRAVAALCRRTLVRAGHRRDDPGDLGIAQIGVDWQGQDAPA